MSRETPIPRWPNKAYRPADYTPIEDIPEDQLWERVGYTSLARHVTYTAIRQHEQDLEKALHIFQATGTWRQGVNHLQDVLQDRAAKRDA